MEGKRTKPLSPSVMELHSGCSKQMGEAICHAPPCVERFRQERLSLDSQWEPWSSMLDSWGCGYQE